MPKPKKVEISLKERLERLRRAGINKPKEASEACLTDETELPALPERIKYILNIIRQRPQKSTTMNYLIMYDIEDNKVRRIVSKYLEKQGCLRIQKSVFMANTEHARFQSIFESLKEVNAFYDNHDSIILVPVNVADVRSMKLIGTNVTIETLVDPPNTMFF